MDGEVRRAEHPPAATAEGHHVAAAPHVTDMPSPLAGPAFPCVCPICSKTNSVWNSTDTTALGPRVCWAAAGQSSRGSLVLQVDW